MPEDGGLINQALIGLKPVNACVHTYTKPQTSSTRSRGLGWRIHESVEDTKLSTNKQHSLSLELACLGVVSLLLEVEHLHAQGGVLDCGLVLLWPVKLWTLDFGGVIPR